MNKLKVYESVALRPWAATQMLWNHRRTLKYLWKNDKASLYSHIFTTYFVRGEDCGKGILDPIWKLTGWSPFLWDLEMEVTTACYLKCIHCEHTYWGDKSYLNQHLDYATLLEIVEETPHLRWINLTGEGTSILNPLFTEMVEYIKHKGIYLDFSHDFARIDEQDLHRWVLAGVDRIYWSFDGVMKNTYNKIRVGADYWEVLENIQKLIDIKRRWKSPLPEICFRYCFFKDNVDEISLIPKFLYNLVGGDIKAYGDEPSINIVALLEFKETRGWECEVPNATIQQVNRECKELGFKVYWSHVTHIEEEKPPLDYCVFWSEPYIMITGHVVPCCGVMMSNNRPELEELSFGNIHEQPLRDIWFSEKYRSFRKMIVNPRAPVPKVCMGCRVFNTAERARRHGVR